MEFDSGLPVPDLPGYGGESHAEMMERLCNKVREKFTAADCMDAISEMGATNEIILSIAYRAAHAQIGFGAAKLSVADEALGRFIRQRIEDYMLRLAEFEVR